MQLDREIAAGGWYIAKQLANSSVIFDWPHLVCMMYHATQRYTPKTYAHTLSTAILYAQAQQSSMLDFTDFSRHGAARGSLWTQGARACVRMTLTSHLHAGNVRASQARCRLDAF